jgi:glutamate/tyrosine decarboxylase-like PLP-dependent enzyme
MTRAVGPNTIMLVGSAPPFPYGMVDPLERLSALAVAKGLWFHVDCCVGGFILPFVRELGHDVPEFDFQLDGVSSISIDLHKYGYSGRGASVLILRSGALAAHQGFAFDAWPAGIYRTASIAGSRNGGAVASAYAVMRYLGRAGYRERVARMIETKRRITGGLKAIEGVGVLGAPEGTHFSIVGQGLDIHAVGDGLADRGWLFSRGVDPNTLQLLLNPRHGAIVEEFLSDIAEVANRVRQGHIKSRGVGPVYIV